MPIHIQPDTSNLATPNYYSTKKVIIPTFLPKDISELEYSTCIRNCVPSLLAFTDGVGQDFYKNDFYRLFLNLVSGGSVVLKIIDCNGLVTTVTDNTYGELVTVADKYFTYRFEFYKIWDNLGYGTYHFEIENLNGSGSVVQREISPKFRLIKYSPENANGTIRIETQQRGILKHNKSYTDNSILGAVGANQQIRFKGKLMFSGEVVENDELQLNNANRSLMQIKDQVFPAYEMRIDLVSSKQITQVLFDYLFANNVRISDYNLYNHVVDPSNLSATAYRSLPVKRTSTSFTSSSKQIRKTYTIGLEYANKNVFKINV